MDFRVGNEKAQVVDSYPASYGNDDARDIHRVDKRRLE